MTRALRTPAALLLAAGALAAMPAAAMAAARHPTPTRAQAVAALAKVKQLSQGKGVHTGFELSPALAELSAQLPALDPGDRREAEAILARPDDTQPDPGGTHKWSIAAIKGTPYCLANFCVHWVKNTADAPDQTDTKPANGVPDYVEQMADVLQNEVFPCENGTAPAACAGQPGLGWRPPASDGTLGGDGKVDVYIEDLFTNERVFGYVATDPGQPQDPAVPHFAYMVLDKDYSRFAGGNAAGGLAAERVTAAHEYNHVLQNAYDYLQDPWMFESTAVYIEDKVYPDNNDYLHYIPSWTTNTKQPLTTFTASSLKPYGSAVWNHWLDHRFGPAAVRAAWEASVANANFAPAAYGAAIGLAGGGGFSDEFDRFSAAVAEWDAPGSGFPDLYPDVNRDGTLAPGTQTAPFSLPHTTFALFDVPVPPVAVIRFVAALPAGVAGAVALVGRTGPDPAGGTVTTNLTPLPSGGTGAVQLDNPGAFGRITAVVVNSDASHGAFDPNADDYVFTRDAQNVVAGVIQPGPPLPTTGPASSIADHAALAGGSVDPHLNDTSWYIEYGRTSSYGSATTPQQVPGSTLGAAAVTASVTDLKASTIYHYRVVAANPSGGAAGADMTFKTARDVTPPSLSVKAKPQKIRSARTRGLLYLARCTEQCFGTAEVRLSRATARKLGLPLVLGKTRVNLAPAKKFSKLRVRLGAKTRKRLAGVTGLRVTLAVTVTDASANRATKTGRVRLAP